MEIDFNTGQSVPANLDAKKAFPNNNQNYKLTELLLTGSNFDSPGAARLLADLLDKVTVFDKVILRNQFQSNIQQLISFQLFGKQIKHLRLEETKMDSMDFDRLTTLESFAILAKPGTGFWIWSTAYKLDDSKIYKLMLNNPDLVKLELPSTGTPGLFNILNTRKSKDNFELRVATIQPRTSASSNSELHIDFELDDVTKYVRFTKDDLHVIYNSHHENFMFYTLAAGKRFQKITFEMNEIDGLTSMIPFFFEQVNAKEIEIFVAKAYKRSTILDPFDLMLEQTANLSKVKWQYLTLQTHITNNETVDVNRLRDGIAILKKTIKSLKGISIKRDGSKVTSKKLKKFAKKVCTPYKSTVDVENQTIHCTFM